jgi:hypothetical protein
MLMARYKGRKAKFVEIEKKNGKGETMKKPEII